MTGALEVVRERFRHSLFRQVMLLAMVAAADIAGALAWLSSPRVAGVLWLCAGGAAIVPAGLRVFADLRRGRYGADLLALLALASTAVVGEYFACGLIALMVTSGLLLEAYAGNRAKRDLTELLRRAPAFAHRKTAGGMDTIPAAEVRAGDRLLVLSGETVPADGELAGPATFDESALTGEPVPVARAAGEPVRSGAVNAGGVAELTARATAEASTYAGIVTLARDAAAAAAPVTRLADRVAIWFLPVALLIAGLAWALSGDPVRAVAVIVTATPCPLLLAVPVAVTAGMSRSARAGVVVKDGAALESLGRARNLAMDKTGTVTVGRPEVTEIATAPGADETELLRLAAAVEQYSPHVLAQAVLRAAHAREVEAAVAQDVSETAGVGATGRVGTHQVSVGRPADAAARPPWAAAAIRRARLDLASIIWISVDGTAQAALLVRDQLRPEAARTMRRLRAAGFHRLLLLTGDRVDNANDVARMLGLTSVLANIDPAGKAAIIRTQQDSGVTVMVGDGVNDAPALAAADVGVALGSRGSTAAAQSADAVIVDDRIGRLADAVDIAQRAHRLAVQSAVAGTVLSAAAMLIAAFGWLVPAAGALVQEGIDVAVILNALRALRAGRRRDTSAIDPLISRFAGEHDRLRSARSSVRLAADALSADGGAAYAAVTHAFTELRDHVLPHERAEETALYPALTSYLRDPEALMTMSRAHREIERLTDRLRRHLEDAGPKGFRADQLDDLRATLYGLDAVLTLHFAQEDEALFTLSGSSS